MNSNRSRRVGEQIQRELAELIQFTLKDPRLGRVTLSQVEVSRDLAYAKVYVTPGLGTDIAGSLQALTSAAGFLRRELGRRMKLRMTPELRFIHDTTLERASNISELIERARADDRSRGGE